MGQGVVDVRVGDSRYLRVWRAMLPVMIGGYLLGSDAELIMFEGGGVAYRRDGATHAVDPQDPVNAGSGVMGYAICGMPVRIWRDEAFDPRAPEAHDRCVAGARTAAST